MDGSGERYTNKCVMERDSCGGQNISHQAGPVIFQNIGPDKGNGVTIMRYINQVFRLHIVFYSGRSQHHMFQQDNSHAHSFRASRDFLQQYNIRIMPWPALSPDSNLIQHLWDELKKNPLNEVRPRPITAAYLSVAFLRISTAIQMAFINSLIHSTFRRCVSSVVNVHEGHTKY